MTVLPTRRSAVGGLFVERDDSAALSDFTLTIRWMAPIVKFTFTERLTPGCEHDGLCVSLKSRAFDLQLVIAGWQGQ